MKLKLIETPRPPSPYHRIAEAVGACLFVIANEIVAYRDKFLEGIDPGNEARSAFAPLMAMTANAMSDAKYLKDSAEIAAMGESNDEFFECLMRCVASVATLTALFEYATTMVGASR